MKILRIYGLKLKRSYKLNAPKGLNGRNSDNTKVLEYLGWEPSIWLKDGLANTFEWIQKEIVTVAARR